MFNQHSKPAFKFVIKSKIDATGLDKAPEKPTTATPAVATHNSTETSSKPVLDDRKRKHPVEKDTAPPKKKIHSQLEKWNKKKEELKHESEQVSELERARKDYADLTTLACILCQRKFKSKADVQKHQELSELHKKNLDDPLAVNKAELKMNFSEEKSTEKKEPDVEYRNRAAERRQYYGQPEKPVLEPSSPPRPIPSREIAAIQQASLHVPISDDNKGARMLAKMGWNKGEGLGKNNSGILDPVKAESYAQSAGVGASSKRSMTSTEDTYRNRTLDLARKRLMDDK